MTSWKLSKLKGRSSQVQNYRAGQTKQKSIGAVTVMLFGIWSNTQIMHTSAKRGAIGLPIYWNLVKPWNSEAILEKTLLTTRSILKLTETVVNKLFTSKLAIILSLALKFEIAAKTRMNIQPTYLCKMRCKNSKERYFLHTYPDIMYSTCLVITKFSFTRWVSDFSLRVSWDFIFMF